MRAAAARRGFGNTAPSAGVDRDWSGHDVFECGFIHFPQTLEWLLGAIVALGLECPGDEQVCGTQMGSGLARDATMLQKIRHESLYLPQNRRGRSAVIKQWLRAIRIIAQGTLINTEHGLLSTRRLHRGKGIDAGITGPHVRPRLGPHSGRWLGQSAHR